MQPKSAPVFPSIVLSLVRVALGAIWLNEGIVKLRAGFGGNDIKLVIEAANASVSRTPEFYKAFTTDVLGRAPGFFGFMMPLIEVGLGVALILGILTLPVALGSVFTVMNYWLADQLILQYPVIVILSVIVVTWIAFSSRYSVSSLVKARIPKESRAATLIEGPLGTWL